MPSWDQSFPWLGLDYDLRLGGADIDVVIAAYAERQHGLVHRDQLLDADVAPGTVDYRVNRGRLIARELSVYSAGPGPLTKRAAQMIPVLQHGPIAVLSHWTAAPEWKLRREPSSRIHVTVAGRNPKWRRDRKFWVVESIDSRDIRFVDGIPFTSPARTLLDLAPHMTDYQLQRAYDELRIARLVKPHDVIAAIERDPTHRGARKLKTIAERETEPVDLREAGEAAMHKLLEKGGLSDQAEFNGVVDGKSFDVVFRDAKYIVEFDGYGTHTREYKFKGDRAKTNAVHHLHWRVDRFVWEDPIDTPERFLVIVATAVAARTAERPRPTPPALEARR